MDILIKRTDALTSEKAAMAITTQAMDARMTCEVYGDTRHSGNYFPTIQEDVMYITTTTMIIVHKEVKRGINHALTIRKVIKVILTIQTNLP
jgi:hypothetical protein